MSLPEEQSAAQMLAVIMAELAQLRSIPADVHHMANQVSEVRQGMGELSEKVDCVDEKLTAVESDVMTLKDNTISLAARLRALETAKNAPVSSVGSSNATTTSSVHGPRVTRRRIDEVGSAAPPHTLYSPEDENMRSMLKLTGLPSNYSRDERLKVAQRVVAELEAADYNVPKHDPHVWQIW